METSVYLQVNMIPIAALLMVRLNAEKTLSYSWRNRALRFLMVVVAGVMTMNMAAWLVNGRQFFGAGAFLWIFNTLHFALIGMAAFLWYLYVCDIVLKESGQRGRKVLIPALPCLVELVLLLLNPWHKLLFYSDDSNFYVRGAMFAVPTAVVSWYVIAATIRAIICHHREVNKDRRRECRWLAGFAILPVTGGVLQIFFYGLDLLWLFTAASLIMVYLNVQQEQVTRDSLTGLNNRRRLDQYLEELAGEKSEESCFCLLMDVDKFKKINDTCGHLAGDAVLRQMAEQLKRIFGDSRSFLARYGGDEFVVLLRGKTEREVQTYIENLKKSVTAGCGVEGMNWEVSVSVGYAKWQEDGIKNPTDLVALADSRMYEQKKKNR